MMGPIAVALKHLIAAGVTGDALVTAVAEMEAATKPVRTAGAVRMARYRESKKEATEASQVTHGDACTPPDKEEKGFHTFLKEEINHPLATLATHAREEVPHPSNAENPSRFLEFNDVFWPAWPHKVGKPAALKAFFRVRRTSSLEAIISGRDRYIAEKPPGRQWLNPATFLNQERFNDEPAAVVEPAKRELPHDTLFRAMAKVAKDGPGAVGWTPNFDGAANVTRLANPARREPDYGARSTPKPRPHIAEAVARARSLGGDSGGVVVGLPDAGAVGHAVGVADGGLSRGAG